MEVDPQEPDVCQKCGSDNSQIVGSDAMYNLYKCRECGNIWMFRFRQ